MKGNSYENIFIHYKKMSGEIQKRILESIRFREKSVTEIMQSTELGRKSVHTAVSCLIRRHLVSTRKETGFSINTIFVSINPRVKIEFIDKLIRSLYE